MAFFLGTYVEPQCWARNKEASGHDEQQLQEGPGRWCLRSGSGFTGTLRFIHPCLVQSSSSAPSGRLHLKTLFVFMFSCGDFGGVAFLSLTAHREEKAEA